MSTLAITANEMAKRFIRAKDKKYALNQIVYDMNYLVYSSTQEPLDYRAKSAVFTYIFNVIAGRETLQYAEAEEITPDFNDIIIFFERRDFILKHLRAGIKQQCQFN